MQRTLLKAVVLALTGVALYATAGYWIAPRIVERKLVATVAQKTGLTLAIEAVAVNPFTLTLSLNNVTLFRPQSTPAVSIGVLDARMRATGFGEWSLVLHDVAVRALEIADFSGKETVLTVPATTTETLVIGPSVTAPAVVRLDRPNLRLQRESSDKLNFPYDLASLLPDPATASGVRFEVSDGSLEFIDESMRMPVRLDSGAVEGTITRRDMPGHAVVAMSFRGSLSDTGRGEISAEWFPSRPRDATRIELRLRDVDMARVSPYIAAAIGRRILHGRMDVTMNLMLDKSELDLDNRIAIRNLQLDRHVAHPGARDLPVELAATLLEDQAGLIAMRVPVPRRPLDSEATLGTVFSQALGDYITEVAGTPFATLAELVGRPDLDLGSVGFQPGSAEISWNSRTTLAALRQALAMRPKLGLTVYPGFDQAADSAALARQQIRLHVNLATSAGMPGEHGATPVDLDDPKVRSVLDEFAATRLPQSRLATITGRFPERDTAHFRAVFEALVANEEVARSTLDRLARYRARSVFDELVSLGTDRSRLRLADEILLMGSGGFAGGAIRLEVQQGAFEKQTLPSQNLHHLDHNVVGAIGSDMRISTDFLVPSSKVKWFSRDGGAKFDRLKPGVSGRRFTKLKQKRSDATADPRWVRIHCSNTGSIDRRITIGVVSPCGVIAAIESFAFSPAAATDHDSVIVSDSLDNEIGLVLYQSAINAHCFLRRFNLSRRKK